jgi:hypothetical protein
MTDLDKSPSECSLLSPSEQRAPVVSVKQTEIAADPEAVWEVLTAFDRWPSWNPDVTSMSLSGPPAVGSTFHWKAGPGTIRSTIRWMEPPRVIAWTGRTLGMTALDAFQLQPRDGHTVVREEESWSGLVARVFRRSLQKTLDRSLESGLRHLKAEVERKQPVR